MNRFIPAKLHQADSVPSIAYTPAIVLCGGAATRMVDVTQGAMPKHLLAIRGKTVLEQAIGPFMRASEIILATGVHSQQIEQFVSVNPALRKVRVSSEDKQMGIIGAIKRAVENCDVQDRFFIVHGDEITPNLQIDEMLDYHDRHGAELTVLATSKPPLVLDFAFTVDDDGRATDLKRRGDVPPNAKSFGIGTFVCERHVLDTMTKYDDWSTFLQALIGARRLHVYQTDLAFFNLNEPQDLSVFEDSTDL